jgi:hypothetical protein
MTALDLAVDEELASSFEPCLDIIIAGMKHDIALRFCQRP